MAYTASTTLTSSGTGGKTNLSVEWGETGTSVSNNTSTISVTAKMTYNSAKWDVTNSGTLKAYFHDNRTGENIEVGSISFNEFGYNTTSRTASGTCTRTHNDDGTLSGYGWAKWIQGSSYGGYAPSTGSCATDSKNLTTIARASTPSLSSSTFNIGDTITINTNRASSSFTHTIKLIFGSYEYTVGTGVGASISLNTANIASSLYAQIPNATSGTGTISCQTFSGSTSIGTKTCTFTAKAVEANVKPTFSNFAYADTNSTITAITGNNQYLVQGKSSLRVTISSANKATARSSATMKTYNASISGLSATANYSTSDLNINFSSNAFTAGNQTLSVKAIDSRGYGTTVSKTVPVLAYASPVINATATRQNNFENTTTLKVSGTYSPLTINNTAKNTVTTVEYRYKSQSTSTWGSWTAMTGLSVTSAGAYTTTDKVLNLDNSQAYDFQIRTTDRIGASTTSLVVSVGIPIMRIGTDGYIYNQEQRVLTTGDGVLTTNSTFTASSKTHSNYPNNASKVPTGNFIAFWNGAYNSSNSSNLTYAHQGTIQCKPKVLWTNSNLGTKFNAQTVSISGLSDYAFIDILSIPYRLGNQNIIKVERHYYDATRENGSISDVFLYNNNRYYGVREYTVNANGIYFSNAINDANVTDNDWYVPWKIIGYK